MRADDTFSAIPNYRDERPLQIETVDGSLTGSLGEIERPRGLVLIANDTGSARHRGCELDLSRALHDEGFATLMIDVLTAEEQSDQEGAARLRCDAMKLAHRISAGRAWIAAQPHLRLLPVALVGEGGAGAAALIEVAAWPRDYLAVVARAAQPLHAGFALRSCTCPVLLVVDSQDPALIDRNRTALDNMRPGAELITMPETCFSGEASSTLHAVSQRIAQWLSPRILSAAHSSEDDTPARAGHLFHSIARPDAALDQ
jgi:hypothetical protein